VKVKGQDLLNQSGSLHLQWWHPFLFSFLQGFSFKQENASSNKEEPPEAIGGKQTLGAAHEAACSSRRSAPCLWSSFKQAPHPYGPIGSGRGNPGRLTSLFHLSHSLPPSLLFFLFSSSLHPCVFWEKGLYFHGRVHLRVLEGCARVFGHHFHASPNYHLLVSPFTSGCPFSFSSVLCSLLTLAESNFYSPLVADCYHSALPIEAVRPTDDVLRLWSQRSNLQSRLSLKQPRSDALHDAIDKKHGITDKMVRQVLERHRKEEDPSRVWDGETVLLLRTFYQERETDHNEEELEEVGGEDDSAKAQMGLRSIVKEKSSSDPPQSPSWTTLQASPASRFFLFESWEMEERKPLQLRAPSQMDSEGSDGSDEETFATNNQSETALPEPLGVALEAHSNRTESQAKETASSMGKSTNNGAEDHRPSLRIPGFYAVSLPTPHSPS